MVGPLSRMLGTPLSRSADTTSLVTRSTDRLCAVSSIAWDTALVPEVRPLGSAALALLAALLTFREYLW